MKIKAFITGATGFVGSHLVDSLIDKGWEIRCLKRKTSSIKWFDGKNITFIEGDLFSNSVLEKAIEDVDFIFHVAGVVKAKSEADFKKSNYLATKNLIEICNRVNPNLKKFVHISSQAVCGPTPGDEPIDEKYIPSPITAYARTKLLAEKEVLKYKDKFPVVIIRPPAVYGPRDTEIFIYFKTYNIGINSIIGFGDKYLSIVYISDLIKGIEQAAESKLQSGEIFFICDDKVYNWDEISNVTAKLMNKKAFKIRVPHWVVYTAGAFAEFFGLFSKKPATLNLEKCKDITQKYWTCSNRKAKELLGFKPEYNLEAGFAETIKWYKKEGWL